MIEREQNLLYVEGIFQDKSAAVIEQVGQEMEIKVERTADPGENYTLAKGGTLTVPEGMVHLRIHGRDLTDFWKRVDSITPQKP